MVTRRRKPARRELPRFVVKGEVMGKDTTVVTVSMYDGGGVEVTLLNYRPLSVHIRVNDDEHVADAVAHAVRGCVLEWVRDQRRRKRVRAW
jgi:hypothetical protein